MTLSISIDFINDNFETFPDFNHRDMYFYYEFQMTKAVLILCLAFLCFQMHSAFDWFTVKFPAVSAATAVSFPTFLPEVLSRTLKTSLKVMRLLKSMAFPWLENPTRKFNSLSEPFAKIWSCAQGAIQQRTMWALK